MEFDVISYAELRTLAERMYSRYFKGCRDHWLLTRDDAVQEALMRCWKDRDGYDFSRYGPDPGKYFSTLIYRAYIDLLRKKTRSGKGEVVMEQFPEFNFDFWEDRRILVQGKDTNPRVLRQEDAVPNSHG